MSEPEKPAAEEGKPYRFDCVMSYLHRYIPADGTWVTVNNFGKFIITFFTDSPPLPGTINTQTAKDGGRFLIQHPPQIIPISDAGTLRRYEASAILTLDAAKILRNTLDELIANAEKIKSP